MDLDTTQSHLLGLGVCAKADEVLIIYKEQTSTTSKIHAASSQNGVEIHAHQDQITVLDISRAEIDSNLLSDFRFALFSDKIYLFYKRSDQPGAVFVATSNSMQTFQTTTKTTLPSVGAIVPRPMRDEQYVMYLGEDNIYVAYSKDLENWNVSPRPVLSRLEDQFGSSPLRVGTVLSTTNGLLVIYYAKGTDAGGAYYSLHGAFFDSSNPEALIRRSETLWEQTEEWGGERVEPIGVVYFEKKLISYWNFHQEGLFAIAHTTLKNVTTKQSTKATDLKRLTSNPLLRPISAHYWESKAVFNPAAVVEDGKIHLLYRAIGDNDVSVLGYASSSDGIYFDERLSSPAYSPRAEFEGAGAGDTSKHAPYSPYLSGGGGWGGCEDPRLTKIDDRFFLTYVAYNGWGPPRVALSSISVDDFVKHIWQWKEPVLISPPGIVDKNAVIFPEKIRGKYVILHRIYPNILLDFVNSLDEFDGETFLKGEHAIRPSKMGWDNRKIGAGAPPIKTTEGWLLIYHSVGEADPGRYKMGAMLLDLQDPTKVLYRTLSPILAPDDEHENNGWKAGVAYPCGAVIVDGKLYIYYGGADTVICAATANLDEFLRELKDTGNVHLQPISIHTKHKIK